MTALWLFLKTFILIRWFPAKNRAALLRRQQKALAAQKTFFRLHPSDTNRQPETA